MNSSLTEKSLAVVWDGEEVDGLLAYGLWSDGPSVEPIFPAEFWPPETSWKRWRLHGEGWAVLLWTIRLRQWPAAAEWESTLAKTLHRFLENGAIVAWFGLEGLFADPPSLFDPSEMSGGVYAVATQDGRFKCRARIGSRFETLNDAELLQLRDLAASSLTSR